MVKVLTVEQGEKKERRSKGRNSEGEGGNGVERQASLLGRFTGSWFTETLNIGKKTGG